MADFQAVRVGELRVCLGLVLGIVNSAIAGGDALCFDFNTLVTTPLKQIAKVPGKDNAEQGQLADRVTGFAALRGEAAQPIEKVLERFQNHETTREPMIKEMYVEKLDPGPYISKDRVKLVVQSFFFKIPWTEEWAYALVSGTPAKPNKIVISFQKTEGTSHIERFCGSIVLERTSKGTDVSQYHEARITRRSTQAILEALMMVLGRVRAP